MKDSYITLLENGIKAAQERLQKAEDESTKYYAKLDLKESKRELKEYLKSL